MSNRRNVLVVDDNFVNRQILCKILSEDYNIFQAENGERALEMLKTGEVQISAILLDIVMPVMDGYSFLQLQQQDVQLRSIPVIVTTQNDGEEAEVKALSMGAYDFLAKPYKPSIIKHRIANTIKLRETASFINTVEHDSLTGVYSKEFFYKKADEIILADTEKQYDIVCVDIERFKLINDLFGTEEGDRVLCHLSTAIELWVKGVGTIGRIGPDTFVALLPHKDIYSNDIFDNIIQAINDYPLKINIVLKFGIYQIEDVTIPLNVMCDRAKLATESIKGMYEVRYAYYDQSFRERMLAEQMITDNMQQALANGEFVVYYQPKYELCSEEIIGSEALVRWIHPEKGFMSPAEFIPLFEKNGFITDLDMYVWEQACKTISRLKKQGTEVHPISVNVSRIDIYNPMLTNILIDLVKKYDFEPKYLHLEITESAYTENPKQLIDVVSTLKTMGFVIEMDDFGTGYSSLNMLSELPIDMLKLDMRFLKNKATANDGNIISFIISLAKWMNLKVVAEGVETYEQVAMLRHMDCNYAQGFYYARPMPEKDFETLLEKAQEEKKKNTGKYIPPVKVQGETSAKKNDDNQEEKSTMLVVDDMETNRAILVEIFKDKYNVVETENGEEAMEYLLGHPTEVSIVLLDLLMPVIDGFQTLSEMKNNVILKDIPAIITSQAGEGSEARALALGAADFIGKPYSTDVAIRRVSNVMADVNLKRFEREQELKSTVHEMQRIINNVPGGIITYKLNLDGTVEMIYYNQGFCDILGYSYVEYREVKGDNYGLDFVCEEDKCKLTDEIYAASIENRNADIVLRVKHRSTELVWVHLTGVKIQQTPNSQTYHCIIVDTTEEHKNSVTLKERAEIDQLTGLYNRMKIQEKVTQYLEKENGAPAVFVMLDIDNFKQVNDVLGHAEGDSALQMVASKLKSSFRRSDMVSRFGGDEFIVFMPGFTNMQELKIRLSDLCKNLSMEFTNGETTVKTGCSVGVCIAPNDGVDFRTLYQNSDKALLCAKRMGKNQFHMFSDATVLPEYTMTRNMDWLLDEIADGVLVCDAVTYETLYMNRAARELSISKN
ncbi:MAG: EAL domain-containing protein, partial [Oscillospiraceae bacterium]